MKTPLRTWQKTALAALLSVCAIGASAATSSVVPVATDALATEDISALDAGDTLSSAWSTSASSIDDVASVEAAAIVLDTGDDSLTYTPAGVSSTAHAELSLTFSAATTAPAAPTGAQTAITVYSDNGTASYYVWSKGAATAAALADAEWVQVPTLVPTTGTPVSVAFTIDYAKGVVAYVVGGVNAGEYWLATSATQISSLNFQGTGTLTGSIVTKAAATASILPAAGGTETFYATEAEALANASSGASLSLWTYDGANSQWTSASSSVDWAYLLGAAVATDTYEIDNLAELKKFQLGVNTIGLPTSGITFKQTADIALDAAWPGIGVPGGKDIVTTAAYDTGAFAGTYDGGNYTISNFQMENGTDYGALFNSIYGATIRNLKISWGSSTLCANSSSTGGDTGATFVGVAKGSTLSNLTALGTANVTTVSASKDFGGIVGYLMAGSTVDSCTNELNVASLKGGRKCGGIAIITQAGSGTATLRNCKNSGTSAGGAQDGAIVGYIGVDTAIIGCENTADAPLLTSQSGTVTVSGGTKSLANRAPFVKNGGTVIGLNYATVDNNVATFVADNALAAGNTYKVMASGVTPTYQLTTAGDFISFDTSLVTPASYAITGATGLTVSNATANDVITYTAATQTFQIRWIDGDGSVLATDTVDYGNTPAYAGATPTKAATAQYTYTFANAWSPAIVAATADADYTAQFTSTVNTYSITWKDGDGQVLYVDTVAYGTVPAYDSTTYGTPTKAATAQYSYTFDAWDVAPVAVTGDATYSATFTSTVNRYTITWEDGSGNVLETDADVPYGNSPSYDGATPTKAQTTSEVYTFSEWKDAVGNAVADPVVGNATYIAQFTASARPYTISWDTDGDGNVDDTTTVDYGDTPAHADGSKASTAQFSYTFSGWLGANNGTGIAAVTGAETYTAQFTQTTREYLVTFYDEDGSTEITRESVAYGSAPTYAGVPTKQGDAQYSYAFSGWTNASVASPTLVANLPAVTGDTSYVANYSQLVNTYKIYWKNIDGADLAQDDVAYGQTPAYTGTTPAYGPDAQYIYTFANAWSDTQGGSAVTISPVTGTATYYATYTTTLRTYTILWVVNGTTVETDANVAYGATPTYDGATPTKASTTLFTYTFSGWSPATAAVTGDATYTAQFEAVSRLRPPVLRLADPTLSAVSMNGPSMVVSGEVSSESEGEIVIVADPTATLSDIDSEGAFTARFPDVAWNQPIAWNLSASVGNSETATLPGRAFNKAETQWFSKAADALDTVTGFGDIEAGVAPENASDPGQQVRIQTVLDISASGSTETPDVGNARGGLAVLALNDEDAAYYAFTGDSSKGTNGWVKLYGATPVDGDADLLIVADMDTLDARYYIDGVALYALENEAPVYAISIGGSDKTLSAIGFANPDGVKAPVVAEYDVPYVAAIGNTAYTTAEAAVAALVAADKAIANGVAIDLLANGVSGSVALADGEAVTVNAGAFTSGLTFTAPAGYKVVQNGSTYTVEPDTATVIWVVEGRDNVTETYAIGATPAYPQDAAAPAKAATAQYTYTFRGWNTDSTATTALSSLAPVAAGGATYYAVFSSSVNSYEITWTDHSGTVKTETLEYGATPTAPAADPVQYVENGTIYTGTWPTPASVTGTASYAAVYDEGVAAKATVLTITDNGDNTATTNTVGTYASFAEAVRAADTGDTVVLLADDTADATKTTQADRLVVTKAITIDFGEYTYSVPGSLETSSNWCALFIDADTTVKGTTGGIDCLDKEDPAGEVGVYAFNVREGATLTIEGGAYHGGGTIVQAQLGTVEINGGTFTLTPFSDPYGSDFAFNCVDAAYTAGTAGISISGGTFVGFDPQDNKAEGAGTDFTAAGYVAIDDGNGSFVVQPGYNVTFADEDGSVLETQRVPAGETPVYGGAAPAKASTDSAVYAFSGWSPAIVAAAADTTYTAQFSSIYLDPASLELYPNCSNYVHVIGAPAESTGYFKFAGAIGSGGFNKTELWGKPYGKTPGGTGTVTAYVTNNNEQVAMLVANVTVKDVVAVVDGVEYATADWETAVAAAIQSGSVLEAYWRVANITLPEGKTLRWKAADNRKSTSLIVLAPAATETAMYKVTSTTDSATGITTAVCADVGTPNVMIAKANGTVSYAASFSFSAGATNTVLRDFASARTSVNVMNAVIDLNGHTVTFDTGDTAYAGIMVGSGNVSKGSLTIRDTSAEGTGSIVDSGIPVWVVYNASSVTIESGSIVAGGPAVYGSTASGTITITGGSFETTGNAGYLLNMLDSARGTITVTGGSFQGFDPANNSAEGAGTSFLPATGYVSVADDPSSGWYTVYEAVTVSFVNGKGAAPADQVIGKGKTATAPADPEAEGFTFDGWFAPNAETAFDFTTPVTADLTLTAQWTEDVVEYVGAKAENGFVILDKDDPAAAGKQLAFTKFEIKGSTVEAAISAALANPNDANTATVKAVYTATLDASAAKVYVNATVTHIDVAKGTATVTFALPAGNAAFFRGFADYDAGTDKP